MVGRPSPEPSAREAYAICLRIARGHYENFPVASWLLPGRMRPHIAAIYAFARTADDFADEGDRPDAERLALLDDWARRLHAAGDGAADPYAGGSADAAAIFVALADTMRACRLDRQLFADLLSAFRQDVLVKRYETWADVLDYCRRSANPVGRLMLGVAGRTDPVLLEGSDALCTALQLVNFWQDLERDWMKGRLYVPLELARSAGALVPDLTARRMTPPWRAVLRQLGARTRELFERGRPVVDGLTGRLAWELRATWLGGSRILDRLEAAEFDVFHDRPSLGWRDMVWMAGGALSWRTDRASRETGAPGGQT